MFVALSRLGMLMKCTICTLADACSTHFINPYVEYVDYHDGRTRGQSEMPRLPWRRRSRGKGWRKKSEEVKGLKKLAEFLVSSWVVPIEPHSYLSIAHWALSSTSLFHRQQGSDHPLDLCALYNMVLARGGRTRLTFSNQVTCSDILSTTDLVGRSSISKASFIDWMFISC